MRFQDGVATELQGSRASVESRTLVEGRSSVEGRTSLEDRRASVEMGRIAQRVVDPLQKIVKLLHNILCFHFETIGWVTGVDWPLDHLVEQGNMD